MNKGKAAFKEYKKTGKWREGTILVKELVSVGSKTAVSGKGYFMGDFIGLEAIIKSKKLFSNELGSWVYYSFTNPKEGTLATTAKAFKTNQCNTCHNTSAGDDFVFTQYQILKMLEKW